MRNISDSIEKLNSCMMNNEVKYPLINQEHHCKDYEFRPEIPRQIPDDLILIFAGLQECYPECADCGHNYENRCHGIKWIPIEKVDGICQFFRARTKTCKNAIPYLQYQNHIRNNHCKLPPRLRDGDQKLGWKWNCGNAHTESAERKKCYRPLEE
jgi:hypothetical protein